MPQRRELMRQPSAVVSSGMKYFLVDLADLLPAPDAGIVWLASALCEIRFDSSSMPTR
jgi:hypothetical protein